jgi:hypothetical protein
VYKILQQLNRPKKKALQTQSFFGFDNVENVPATTNTKTTLQAQF